MVICVVFVRLMLACALKKFAMNSHSREEQKHRICQGLPSTPYMCGPDAELINAAVSCNKNRALILVSHVQGGQSSLIMPRAPMQNFK